MITITSKVDGYRRCGVEHPARPTMYPDDQFTSAELAVLSDTPVLQVEVNETHQVQQVGADPEQLEKNTVAELKELAAKIGLTVPDKTTKKELIEMICKEQAVPGPAAAE